ncbi:DUF2630 family protein [Amycolatopsis acidicola]|uniref:DUF2630 family protein n=1 Tax=Amycolatopsis acidicola TaxID=2596893 RepID=A0A5N0UWS8_9PSEU|nr:DUF2630 family protein [Amycolatopsis acidicola]KAA9153609.1 DUF2630 family protein [Amycolatopsis acidicola]
MSEKDIIGNIDGLIAEEHELRQQAIGDGLDEAGQARIKQVEQQLDQCWDLLRQRRARREFGEDETSAEVRPATEVENYRQ